MNILLQLVNIIVAAKIGGYISKKIGQPAVLGEIAAGLIIGPHIFGSSTFFGHMFKSISFVETDFTKGLSELGIIMLLFLVGLEFDIEKIKSNLRSGLFISLIQSPFTLLTGTAMASYLMVNYPGFLSAATTGNIDISTGLLSVFVGVIVSATSIGVSVKVLMEINRLKTKAGTLIVNLAVFDDIITLLLLSTMLSLVKIWHVDVATFIKMGVMITGFFSIFIIFGDYLLKKTVFFGKFLDLRVEEGLFSIIFSLILLLSYLAELSGLSPIIGAFLVGVIIKEDMLGSEVIDAFKKIAYGIFIPIFFTSIGTYINPEIVFQNLEIVSIIFITACLSKFISVTGSAIILGFSIEDSVLVGLGMIPRLEVPMVSASLGLNLGILTQSDFSIIITSLLLTLIFTPAFMKSACYLFDRHRKNRYNSKASTTNLWITIKPLILVAGESGDLKIRIQNIGEHTARNIYITIDAGSVDFKIPLPDKPQRVGPVNIKAGESEEFDILVAVKNVVESETLELYIKVEGDNIKNLYTKTEVLVELPEVDMFVNCSRLIYDKKTGLSTGILRVSIYNPTSTTLDNLHLYILPYTDDINSSLVTLPEIAPEGRILLSTELRPKYHIKPTKPIFIELRLKKDDKKIYSRYIQLFPDDSGIAIDFEKISPHFPDIFFEPPLPGKESLIVFALKNIGFKDVRGLKVWIAAPRGYRVIPDYRKINLRVGETSKPLEFKYKTPKSQRDIQNSLSICWCIENIEEINRI